MCYCKGLLQTWGVRKCSSEEVAIDLESKRKLGVTKQMGEEGFGQIKKTWKGTEHNIFEEVKARVPEHGVYTDDFKNHLQF